MVAGHIIASSWSVTDDDFAHYVIGRKLNWLSLRLNEPTWQSQKEIQDQFLVALTKQQKSAWLAYQAASERTRIQIRLISDKVFADLPDEELREILEMWGADDNHKVAEVYQRLPRLLEVEREIAQLDESLTHAEEQFIQTLDDARKAVYRTEIQPFMQDSAPRRDPPRCSPSEAQRWIIKRVFNMGWTRERFGIFDHYQVGFNGRDAYKPERIGKKYQWLAYHEFLARLADNFQFREESSSHAASNRYVGSWQIGVRDIDPSCVLKSKVEDDDSSASAWWVPCVYDSWGSPVDDVTWLKSTDDLPDIPSLIDIVNPQEDSRWLTLHGFYKWEQPIPSDQDRYEISRRDIFYLLQGYLVHKSDIDRVYDWARQQDFFGRWMPEGRDFYRLYFGGLYWSPAYKYHDDPYMGSSGWQTVSGRNNYQIPKPILPLTETYNVERGTFDCSIDEGYSIIVPIKQLIDEMGLHWNGIEGCFFDRTGQLVACDPSVQEPGPGVLLVRRDRFLEFLEEQGYAVLWTLLGEKNLIGGNIGPDNWKGRTVISGAYRVVGERIVGELSSTFRSPTPNR